MASSQKDSEGSLRLIGEQYYGIARLRNVILGGLFKIVLLYRQIAIVLWVYSTHTGPKNRRMARGRQSYGCARQDGLWYIRGAESLNCKPEVEDLTWSNFFISTAILLTSHLCVALRVCQGRSHIKVEAPITDRTGVLLRTLYSRAIHS
jgi:hypothetical protein